jgi:cysteine desulfurase / selenocysteine lyase
VSGFDVARARADTPGCAHGVHLNNAGASLPPRPVTESVVNYLRCEELHGGYETFEALRPLVTRYRAAMATLIDAEPDEIAIAQNDTQAWATAFWGLVHSGAIAPGTSVVVDRAAYASHYVGLLQAQRYFGLTIKVAESDATGALSLDSLAEIVDERVSVVALTHVGSHRGLVNPVEQAGTVIRGRSNALYVIDACQSLGQLPVSVRASGCDVLTGTGRKYLRAPRGTGVLFVASRVLDRIDPPGIDGHSAAWVDASSYQLLPDARRFEQFEASMANRVGFGVAVDYAMSWGIDAIRSRIVELSEHLRAGLASLGAVEVLDGGHTRSGIVTFRERDREPAATQAVLRAAGVATSLVVARSARLDMDPAGLTSAVRASVHYYNTTDELDLMLSALAAPGKRVSLPGLAASRPA